MSRYKAEAFEELVNRTFRARGAGAVLTLAAIDVMQGMADGAPEAFSLLFRGPAGDVLPEGQYTFDVEGGQSVTFHIMPVHTPVAGRQDYQAVFN